MTDPSREIDEADFIGLGLLDEAEASVALDHGEATTHYVGDDCQPDGHRSDFIQPEANVDAFVDEPMIARGLAELDAAVHGPEVPADGVDGLVALVYESRKDGTPHVVTKYVDPGGVIDVRCTCKAAIFNLPRGCYRMVAARVIWGLPSQGDENA
jgi:hypothetical protein